MPIIWQDSFGLYTAMGLRFNVVTGQISINNTLGPHGSGVVGAFDGATAFRNLSASSNNASTAFTFWSDVGPAGGSSRIFQFNVDSNTPAAQVVLTGTGGVGVNVAGSLVASSAGRLRYQSSWAHVQALYSTSWVPPANNNGVGTLSVTVSVYWNGLLVVTGAGSFNTNSSSIVSAGLVWNQGGQNARWGDWVVQNTASTLDDVGVFAEVPSNNGFTTGWTPSNNNNSNWQLIDEIPPNNGTTFVSAASGNNTADIYAFPAVTVPAGGFVYAVQENLYLRTDAGNNNLGVDFLARVGANNFTTAGNANNNQYQYYSHVYSVDPSNNNFWGLGEIGGSNSQFGQVAV